MFVVCLFFMVKWWKQATCLSVNEWVNTNEYDLTIEWLYLATKRNEILIHAMTQMNFENSVARSCYKGHTYVKRPKQAIHGQEAA